MLIRGDRYLQGREWMRMKILEKSSSSYTLDDDVDFLRIKNSNSNHIFEINHLQAFLNSHHFLNWQVWSVKYMKPFARSKAKISMEENARETSQTLFSKNHVMFYKNLGNIKTVKKKQRKCAPCASIKRKDWKWNGTLMLEQFFNKIKEKTSVNT